MNIGIFGASGLVGQEFLKLLIKNHLNIKIKAIKCYASTKSVNKLIKIDNNNNFIILPYDENTFKNLDCIILCTNSEISKKLVQLGLKYDCFIIDTSTAYRMDKNIPLVIPEINSELIDNNLLIANPNCCASLLCMVLFPLTKYKIKRLIISTYQAASGAGINGLNELINNSNDYPVFGRQYQYNIFSHNSKINQINGYNDEEIKLIEETKKILNIDLDITATCIRVPVKRSHCESVNIEFEDEVDINEIKKSLINQEGIIIEDDNVNGYFPEPIKVENKFDIMVGRIRYDLNSKKRINLFLSGDQLLKGAALNVYQILNKKLN